MFVPVAPVDQVTVPAQPVATNWAFSPSHTKVLSVVMAGAAGFAEVPMVTGSEDDDVPQLVVQVAVYVPAPTWVLVPVAPFDQVTVPAQPVAVNVAFSPSHTVDLSALMDGAAGLSEVPIVTGSDAGDVPQLVVQVAVYVPVPTCTVAPFPINAGPATPGLYQEIVPAHPDAVSVAFSSPHTVALSVVTDGLAGGVCWLITRGPADTVPPQLVLQIAL